MKVITPEHGERTVFVCYTVAGKEYYYYIPSIDYSGLLAIAAEECIITEPSKLGLFPTVSNEGETYYAHRDLQSTNLLSRLIDHDPIAADTFRNALQLSGEII